MYRLNKTLVYFLVLTVIGSVLAYRLVTAAYKSYEYEDVIVQTG